jgi:Family of unknown function (DUF6314)
MKSSDFQHVFDLLLGRWEFVREVPQQASMIGSATISLVEEGTALYEEEARVTLVNGEILTGKQRYLYRRSQPPVNGFHIFFYDTQELFHSLKFSAGDNGRLQASASHLCKADLYLSEYELGGDGGFYVRHTVRGPHKDYVVKTIYSRSIPGPRL